MKKLILVLSLILLVASQAFTQVSVGPRYDNYIPSTLYAGALMSARSDTAAYDDTTKFFNTRGYAAVYVGIETASNDSADIILSYRTFKDGTNANGKGFVVFDSLVISAASEVKYFALPATCLGAYGCQVRVNQQTTFAKYSINPTTKVTTRIIRTRFNQEHN